MILIYKATGTEVKVGDQIITNNGQWVRVTYFRPPHKPSSEGKISIETLDRKSEREFYVSVIGAEWIEREDREEWEDESPQAMGWVGQDGRP